MATLPDKSAEDGFLKLVLDRECAFFVTEVLAAREATIGSDALIASAKKFEGQLTMDNAVYKVVSPGHPCYHQGFKNLLNFANSLAWGDAALRWEGHLPPVAPFAPQPASGLCKVKKCACQNKLPHRDMLAVLKAAPQPDWNVFFDWAEAERKAGRLLAPSAAALRAKLAYVMDRMDNIFLRMIEQGLTDTPCPHADMEIALLCSPVDVVKAFPPLPAELNQGLEATDTGLYSDEQLELLLERGLELRDLLVRIIRNVGNDIHAQAQLQSGQEARDTLENARKVYLAVMGKGGIQALTAMSNLAAIALQGKRYSEVIEYAGVAMTGCKTLASEPRSISAQRLAFMMLFRFGMLPDIPADWARKLAPEDAELIAKVLFKAQCRTLQGHIGECNEDIKLAEDTHRPINPRTWPNIQASMHLFSEIKASNFVAPASYENDLKALLRRYNETSQASAPSTAARGREYQS